MGVTVQVRDLDQAVNDRLKGAAAAKGLSYSEYLRRELTRIAEKLRIEERWREVTAAQRMEADVQAMAAVFDRPRLDIPIDEIVQGIREDRDSR